MGRRTASKRIERQAGPPAGGAGSGCTHRPPCPGCPRFGEPGIAAGPFAELRALASEAGLPDPIVHEGPQLGWRSRARLMVRGRAGSPKVGLFQAGSHRIVDTPACLVHHPLINEVGAALKAAMCETATRPYADAPDAGCVRTLQVVVARASQTAQVVVVTNEDTSEASAPLLADLERRLAGRLHGLFWNGNPGRHNTLIGPHWQHWSGEASIVETVCGAAVHYPPDAFGQANLDLADRLVARIAEHVPVGSSVADLYAGCGAIGLALLARGDTVHFNERGEGSLRGLRMALEALPEATRERASVHPGDAAALAGAGTFLADCDTIVVDPPRRGVDPALLERLIEIAPKRLVYVSCGLPALLLHARALAARGFSLSALEAFALLPFTDHVETLAIFRSARAGNGLSGTRAGSQ